MFDFESYLESICMTSEFEISSDPSRIDIGLVHEFLSKSYWAKGRSVDVVERSILNSLCFGVYFEDQQVAFARLITDRAVLAYLADVFVISEYRGQGISKLLMEEILRSPELKDVRLFRLATKDAHRLYEKYGFERMTDPDKTMELFIEESDL